MDSAKYKDWILETIDQLRKRKARPDLERICHMLERKHGISFQETEADLEKLVEAEIIIKVEYKGSTSYRNAAKWRKSHQGLNGGDASSKVYSAVKALVAGSVSKEDGKGPQTGVSVQCIEDWLLDQDPQTTVTCDIAAALTKEVDSGRLLKLDDDTYAIDGSKPEPKTPVKSKPKSPTKTPSKPKEPKSASTKTKLKPKADKAEKSVASPGKKKNNPGNKRKVFFLIIYSITDYNAIGSFCDSLI